MVRKHSGALTTEYMFILISDTALHRIPLCLHLHLVTELLKASGTKKKNKNARKDRRAVVRFHRQYICGKHRERLREGGGVNGRLPLASLTVFSGKQRSIDGPTFEGCALSFSERSKLS